MRRFLIVAASAVALLWTAVPATPQTESQNERFAQTVVRQLLNVQGGKVLVVFGNPEHVTLAEDIATEAFAIGANAVVTLASNRMNKMYYQKVPSRYDSLPPTGGLRVLGIADDIVSIDLPFDPSVVAGVPASRIADVAKAGNAFTSETLKRSIPTVSIGNGILPSAANARQYGVSERVLSDVFWSGLNTNYSQLSRDVNAVAAAIQGARVRVTARNGTDLSFTAGSSPAETNDGIVSAADRSKGGTAVQKQLPAGDVYFRPQEGTTNGTLVFGDARFNGVVVSGLTLHMSAGRVTSQTVRTGSSEFERMYGAGGAGRDQLAFFDIGSNRSMHVPAAGQWGPGPSMAAGYVTIGIGNDLFLGGSNGSAFAFSSNVPNATVTVNGKTIVSNGTLRL